MSLEIAFTKQWPGGARIEVAFSSDAAVLALFGRSGSGKSTVVNALAGLLRSPAFGVSDAALYRLCEARDRADRPASTSVCTRTCPKSQPNRGSKKPRVDSGNGLPGERMTE